MLIDYKIMRRFWTTVDTSGDCWLWNGYRDARGYGQLHIGNKLWRSYRFAFLLANGYLPKGKETHIHHLCSNPPCVNPSHLVAISRSLHMKISPGFGAYENARKTHCINGHPFSGDNLSQYRLRATGKRECRTCTNNRQNERNHRTVL